jgi:hypothetical protein
MTAGTENGLVVVHAREVVDQALVGHGGREYTSPPQPLEQALALVAVLLGSSAAAPDGGAGGEWSCAVAGGQLRVTLRPAR